MSIETSPSTIEAVNGVWWTWDPANGDLFSIVYHWFNIFEGVAWVVFAWLVFKRFLKYRNSLLECVYGLVFLAFALTDFREAWEQSTWLIAVKGLILMGLLRLRSMVMRKWYPTSKIY